MRSSDSLRSSGADDFADPGDEFDRIGAAEEEMWEIFHVQCPDCRRPIALIEGEEHLPEHALCPTPWNPFGLRVCNGSGRPVEDAGAAGDPTGTEEADVAGVLLTLPEGLDWRTQPFSHVGGPGSRPMRVRRPAA
jgi:hypothetical protein